MAVMSDGSSCKMMKLTHSAKKDIKNVKECVKNCKHAAPSHPTLAPGAAAESAMTMEFYKVQASVVHYLREFLNVLDGLRASIASDWGRLKAAQSVIASCPISESQVEILSLAAFGALQWQALGLLMPSKYVIYFQRDYEGGKNTANGQKKN